ncbi:MAG: hypothetical protein JXR29_02010, partial [Methylothermaceae bacterium]|nr:hypothetical protein [Methylothermaceae bacterium]
ALEAKLKPTNLPDRVRAVVLGGRSGRFDLEEMDIDGNPASAIERLEAIARDLGEAVAIDEGIFAELLPDLLQGGNRVWPFGRGLAGASPDICTTWAMLIEGLERIPLEKRDVRVLGGFLAELWEKNRELVQDFLDSALEEPTLVTFLPILHSAVGLDERGAERLMVALSGGKVPVRMYRSLAFGRATAQVVGGALKDLVLMIADEPEGFDVALNILYMRLHADRSDHREHEPKILEAGRELLRRLTFHKGNQCEDYQLTGFIRTSLTVPGAGPVAAEIAARLRQAVASGETYPWDNDNLLTALLEVQPMPVLESLFDGNERERQAGIRMFENLGDHRGNPADAISCKALIAWCEGDPECRYPLAAAIITFTHRPEASGPQVWSEQAKALVARAPDLRSVLSVFISRFRPMSWSGSRASQMEANGRLLDSLVSLIPSSLIPFVTEAKAKLAEEVARERQWETQKDRGQDERFE